MSPFYRRLNHHPLTGELQQHSNWPFHFLLYSVHISVCMICLKYKADHVTFSLKMISILIRIKSEVLIIVYRALYHLDLSCISELISFFWFNSLFSVLPLPYHHTTFLLLQSCCTCCSLCLDYPLISSSLSSWESVISSFSFFSSQLQHCLLIEACPDHPIKRRCIRLVLYYNTLSISFIALL